MNKLMISVATAALMSTAAFAGPDKEAKSADAKMEKAATAMDKTSYAKAYRSKAEISGKEILGEGVYDETGERIARVDDLLIGADGRAEKFILLSGGVFGFAGERGAVDYNRVQLKLEMDDYDDDMDVRVSMNEAAKEAAAEFEQEGFDDYRLASELIGAKIDLASVEGEDDDAVINDLIFTADGRVKYVIVQESVISSIGAGERYAVDYAKLDVAQGDGGLLLNVTEEELEATPRYIRTGWAEEHDAADDVEDAVEDAADDID